MAERRMFSKTIIDSDDFLDMPVSAQLLYFHLALRADDDGFINKAKSIMKVTGCRDDDMKILIAKSFIIPFESGVVAVKHWKIHNYIPKDRYKETKHTEEKAMLSLDATLSYTTCIQPVYKTDTQDRLGKDRLGKDRLGKDRSGKDRSGKDRLGEDKLGEEREDKNNIFIAPEKKNEAKHRYGEHENVLLTDDELRKLRELIPEGYEDMIEKLSSYIESTGKSYKNHYATIRNWIRNEEEKRAKEEKSRQEEPVIRYGGGLYV